MGTQRQSQTRKTEANSQPQGERSASYTPHPIEELQGWIGNRAMGRILQTQRMSQESEGLGDSTLGRGISPLSQGSIVRKPLFRGLSHELMAQKQQQGTLVQAKLMVGKPDDLFEEEAERVAAQVVQQIDGQTPHLSSQGEAVQREEMEAERLQRKPSVESLSVVEGGMAAPSELEAEILGARGRGQPLAESVRVPMEQAFGADFSGVRVHTDAQSDELNQSLSSRAFTTGEDIFFRQGEYDPGSRDGQELLAHELTHVVQQSGSVVLQEPNERSLLQEQIQSPVIYQFTNPGVIQGKFGFELELTVVTEAYEPKLKQYHDPKKVHGVTIGSGTGFKINVDHQKQEQLVGKDVVDKDLYDSEDGIPIIEIVTDPIDENAPNSMTELNAQIQSLKTLQTGLKEAIGERKKLSTIPGVSQAKRNVKIGGKKTGLQNTNAYVHSTYGIKVDNIAEAFKAHAEVVEKRRDKDHELKRNLELAVAVGKSLSTWVYYNYKSSSKNKGYGIKTKEDLARMEGLFILLANYMISYTDKPGSLGKNSLGLFFYKSNLSDIQALIPARQRQLLEDKKNILLDKLKEMAEYQRGGKKLSPDIHDWDTRVLEILEGTKDRFLEDWKNPYSPTLGPEEVGERDQGGNRGIGVVVENRHVAEIMQDYGQKIKPEDWEKMMRRVYQSLRLVNMDLPLGDNARWAVLTMLQ